jgi:hypothetical protein
LVRGTGVKYRASLLSLDRIGMYGMSAGGHTALMLAGRRWPPPVLLKHCEAHLSEDFRPDSTTAPCPPHMPRSWISSGGILVTKMSLSLSQSRTMRTLSSEDLERIAHKRAGAKLGWYVHAAVYIVVNLFVFAISSYGFGERPWSVFPLLGWGLGLGLHGISVFMLGAGGEFRERLVQQERDRLRRHQDGS